MVPAQRRQQILQAVRAGTAHVAELARVFDVSEMTVRRDLRALARDGKLERVHGGAVDTVPERPFEEIALKGQAVKNRIGAAAAALVADGQTVMIDIGTTTLQVARHLRGRDVTVVTTSLAVYDELRNDPDVELVLSGGLVRRNYLSLVGVLAEDSLKQLNVDIAFIGTSGVAEDLSVWDTTMVEVPIKRAMIAAAAEVVLLADAEKFSMPGAVRICGADSLHHIVTDADIPATRRAAIEDAGIEVTIA
ncbi:DeoR/GlpR family DNA-binding transcription regulator [Conexibacter stalactiti]|uniref:DeoR/GlpR family DNA-binding transcription regulator n=1 Tax=Conexibacter stalactiti TaxID=1940611 RepID=UPI00384DA3D1